MIDVAALPLAESVPADTTGAVVLVASLLITAAWLYYLFE